MGINQGKIEKPTGPAQPSLSSTMKLLIVLGLFPLFSAQQFGFGSFSKAPPRSQHRQKNNNNKINNWPMFGFNNKNNNFGYGGNIIDGINAELIRSLRFMTDSLANMLMQVADDPRTEQVFKAMDSVCVSNMQETIAALRAGSRAAEQALLDSTELLVDAAKGDIRASPEDSRKHIEQAFKKLSGNAQRNTGYSNKNFGW